MDVLVGVSGSDGSVFSVTSKYGEGAFVCWFPSVFVGLSVGLFSPFNQQCVNSFEVEEMIT